MPTRAMEQSPRMRPFRLAAASESSFSDELRLRSERQVGQLKQESVPELGVEKLKPIGARVVDRLETMQPYKLMDQKTQYGLEHRLLGQERHVNLLPNPCRVDQDPAHQHDSFSMTPSLFPNGATENLNGTHYENGLFSSSLPDIFNNKMRLISKNAHSGQLVEKVDLDQVDDELFELTDEIEAQTIGNLLPDDDDLLSGVLDNVGYTVRANNRDDIDDDIFYTGGGMELEADENNKLLELNGGVNNGSDRLNDLLIGEHPYGAYHSRTLFVRNINSNVDDSELKFLFEQYGDIRSLYTASKHLGFVMISYYDIRSAENAMKALQSKQFGRRNLDIHYYPIPKDNHSERDFNQGTLVVFNLDQSVTNDILCHIFGSYGEIKEIRNTSQKVPHKSIEFYDIRAAEAAFHALNRRDIAGQKINIETSCSGGTKSSMQHMSPKMVQEVLGACKLENPYGAPSTGYGSVDVGPITSTDSGNGMVRILRSKVQAPINQFRGRTFLDAPATTTQQISSPVGITSAGAHNNQFALGELSHSLRIVSGQNNEHMNYGFQDNGAFHPHSLPEFHNGLSNGPPYNLSTIPPVGVNRDSRTAEAMVSGNNYKGSPGNLSGHSSSYTEALRFSRTGSPLLHGHRFPWSNSNNFHHQPSSPMPWPSSGAFIDNVPSRPSTHMHGISRTSRMHENIHPMDHHVGSAPAVNPSIWERRYGYAGNMVEAVASGFHPGSVGNNGFPGSSHLHQLELSSVYPKSGGSRIDTAMSPVQIGTPSPQHRGYMLHGRSHTVSHPCSFDSRGERMRSRRNESAANQSDNRRQYELDIEKIVRGEDCRTTLMIKNIPNKYTSKMLLAVIDETHRGTYDFIYLPIDFKNKCNVGYAFINMISTEHIIPFYKTFNGRRWEKFNSEKVASLVYARIQGKSALIAHFQNSSLMNEDKRCRPILFHSDGPNAGDQEPFPVGAHIRSRSGRPRFLSVEENHEDILSTSASSESHPIRVRATSGYTKEEDPTVA